MVKKSKRKQDIRSKLVAAVAMLMVATIMMVSSTYAWFTLSTAPEVQGITTTVGSNGSLEIALAPEDGGTNVENATQNTTLWTDKNKTWGNLLNLSDASYGLADLMLLPAQLVIDQGKLTNSPLATPNYGADGRIQGLLENTLIGGRTKDASGNYKTGFYEGGLLGIRAVGTSDTMSEQGLVYKNSIAAIKSHASKSSDAASKSLKENGAALASIMVQYASSSGTDYAAYVPALQALTTDLNDSVNEMIEMLRAGLLISITPIADVDTFNDLRTKIEGATVLTIQSVITEVKAAQGVVIPAGFDEAVTKVVAVMTKVSTAKGYADALPATGTVAWDQVSPVMTELMNVDGDVKIRSEGVIYSIDDVKAKKDDFDFLVGLLGDCEIILGAGSGVYYDIAEISGPVSAYVNATVTGTIGGDTKTVTIRNALIRTNYTGTTKSDALYAGAGAVTANGDSKNQMVNVNYGYIVDFVFRTNASGAHLLLQTEGIQRVYEDSNNPATAGKGSVFTYTVPDDQAASVRGLMSSIFVVFFDTNSSDVFAVAGVTVEDSDVVANGDGTTTITGALELRNYDADDDGYVTVSGVNGSNELCALGQNQVKAVSAMVYLDGNNVTNADVLNNTNIVGALNLQFASSVDLVPMENTALKNEGTVTKFDVTLKVGAAEIETKEEVATQGASYSIDLDDEVSAEDMAKIASITVTMGGTEVQDAYNDTEHTITIENVTGDIEVIVTLTENAAP